MSVCVHVCVCMRMHVLVLASLHVCGSGAYVHACVRMYIAHACASSCMCAHAQRTHARARVACVRVHARLCTRGALVRRVQITAIIRALSGGRWGGMPVLLGSARVADVRRCVVYVVAVYASWHVRRRHTYTFER